MEVNRDRIRCPSAFDPGLPCVCLPTKHIRRIVPVHFAEAALFRGGRPKPLAAMGTFGGPFADVRNHDNFGQRPVGFPDRQFRTREFRVDINHFRMLAAFAFNRVNMERGLDRINHWTEAAFVNPFWQGWGDEFRAIQAGTRDGAATLKPHRFCGRTPQAFEVADRVVVHAGTADRVVRVQPEGMIIAMAADKFFPPGHGFRISRVQ